MSAMKRDHDAEGAALLIFGILSVIITVGISELVPVKSPDLLTVLVCVELVCIVTGLMLLSE